MLIKCWLILSEGISTLLDSSNHLLLRQTNFLSITWNSSQVCSMKIAFYGHRPAGLSNSSFPIGFFIINNVLPTAKSLVNTQEFKKSNSTPTLRSWIRTARAETSKGGDGDIQLKLKDYENLSSTWHYMERLCVLQTLEFGFPVTDFFPHHSRMNKHIN